MTDKWPEEEGFISEGEIVSLFKATAAITKGTLVQLTGDLEVQPAVANSDPIGVALKDVESGESVPVCIHGVCKVKAGGAITRGKAVKSDASARALEMSDQAVDESGTATYTIYYARKAGVALQSASAADDWILIFICK
jgi:predicted RecA/RadA family phage recombinase